MKNPRFSPDKNQKHDAPTRVVDTGELNPNKAPFPLEHHEVAGRAYHHYLNQGSGHGRDIDHWLNAEAELIAERKLTRTHGYPNQN